MYGYDLTKLPTHIVISMANFEADLDDTHEWSIGYSYSIDDELDSRAPLDTHFHFGDCADKAVFLPIEEYDYRGQLITSEMIGHDKHGGEVWL